MVPVRLHLYNFLSYGDSAEPIELEGIHVACLCGPNGHGKSAILDAITWALWGQARCNAGQDLVRLNQAGMFVDLEFLLDDRPYRAVRKWARARAGQTDLHFMTREEDGQWRPLNGQGVRGTQERINTALRMDYETFINSAFLLQGRADEFARKTPGDRKKILGEILNLRLYDQLCDAARVRMRESQMRAASLDADLGRLEREYARLPELHAAVGRLNGEHGSARLVVAESRARHQGVVAEKTRLDTRRRECEDLGRRLASAEGELGVLRGQAAAARARIANAQALIGRGEEIRSHAAELAAVCEERDGVVRRMLETQSLETERGTLQARLQEARHKLELALHEARGRVRDLRGKAEQIPTVASDMADLEQQAAALDRLQEEWSVVQARLPELAALRAEGQAEFRRCAAELVKAEERFRLLKNAQAACPLCEGPLPDEKRKELGWRLREERTALNEARDRAANQEAAAQTEDSGCRRRLLELDTRLKTGQHIRDRLTQTIQKHHELVEAASALPNAQEVAEGLERQVNAGEFAPELRARLAELEARIGELGYSRERHQWLVNRSQQLAGADRRLDELQRAEAGAPADRQQLQALDGAVHLREAAMSEDQTARAAAERELARAPAVEAELGALEAALAEAERREASISRQLGAAQEAVQQCEAIAGTIAGRKRERTEAANDAAAHEELVKAFGRNGIQALIIENALPEIEQVANELLHRMSDGQLMLRLKATKELRAGGQAETLDIEISDSIGMRRYELYSGGESFRVNFALRIALSRLLAGRAGARLETLFIDEGFGSQDQEGRDRLIEAIHAVQEDFKRILVITHLDELKDQFPVRLEVTKGPAGSHVAIY